MFCKHNYVYTQGHFYCTKCHHRTHKEKYGKRHGRKKQIKKMGIGIAIVSVLGIIGFMFINGVFEINQENLEKSIETISKESPQIIRDTSIQIQEKSSEILKKLEEEQKQRAEEQKLADAKYLQDIALKIHGLINEERTSRGIPVLALDPTLAQASLNHSTDMATRGYFEHNSPEGHDFTWRYSQVGFNCMIPTKNNEYSGGGENIMFLEGYSGVSTIATESVQGWMNSEGHRENILTTYFRSEGIGVGKSDSGKIYVTQDFC